MHEYLKYHFKLTPGTLYLSTWKDPMSKSASLRNKLSPGPEKNMKCMINFQISNTS